MIYETKIETVTVAGLELRVECLKDFERTIDLMFMELERDGREELLTELCPYFGRLWPSALGLARHLAALPAGALVGRRLLELGCGLALPGLVAARLGAQVTVSDTHPEVPRFLRRNLAHNAVDGVDYRELDWRRAASGELLRGYDWIVASDVLYERDHPALLAALLTQIAGPSTRIAVADPGRAWLQDFVTAIDRAGFVSTLDAVASGDDARSDGVFLITAQRAPR